MSQPYGYAGQPPYQQQAGYYPQGSNPYQSGPQPPPPAGWAPQGGQPVTTMTCGANVPQFRKRHFEENHMYEVWLAEKVFKSKV
uniref:Rhodopsin n=1 Tax=Ascaris lumbricoides TaxID=6252 RepID=A0A0M3IQ70_ASCLU